MMRDFYIKPAACIIPLMNDLLQKQGSTETEDWFGKEFDDFDNFGDEWFSGDVKDYTDIWLSDDDSK